MGRTKCLVMCRTGMGSSMMLKISVENAAEANGWDIDVAHDSFSGYMGQTDVDMIVTMEDLTSEFEGSDAYVIGVRDIMDEEFLADQMRKYFEQQ